MGFALLTASLIFIHIALATTSYGLDPASHAPLPNSASPTPQTNVKKDSIFDPNGAAARYWTARIAAGFPFNHQLKEHSPIDDEKLEREKIEKVPSTLPASEPLKGDSISASKNDQKTAMKKQEKVEKWTVVGKSSFISVPSTLPAQPKQPSGYGLQAAHIEKKVDMKKQVKAPSTLPAAPSFGIPSKNEKEKMMKKQEKPLSDFSAPSLLSLSEQVNTKDEIPLSEDGSGYGISSGEELSTSENNDVLIEGSGEVEEEKEKKDKKMNKVVGYGLPKVDQPKATMPSEPTLLEKASSYGSTILNAASDVESELETMLTGDSDQEETTTTTQAATTTSAYKLNEEAARAYWATASLPELTVTPAASQLEKQEPKNDVYTWEQRELALEREIEQLGEELVEAKNIRYAQTHPKNVGQVVKEAQNQPSLSGY